MSHSRFKTVKSSESIVLYLRVFLDLRISLLIPKDMFLFKVCELVMRLGKGMNTPSGKRQASSGSFKVLTLALKLRNGEGVNFQESGEHQH